MKRVAFDRMKAQSNMGCAESIAQVKIVLALEHTYRQMIDAD